MNAKEPMVVCLHKLKFSEFEEENIVGAIIGQDEFGSITTGLVRVGQAQTPHLHNRPSNGIELILVYQGKVEVIGQSGVLEACDADKDGPLFVKVPSGQPASLRNVGDVEVRFFSVFLPAFEMGEIVYLSSRST